MKWARTRARKAIVVLLVLVMVGGVATTDEIISTAMPVFRLTMTPVSHFQ